MIENKNNKNLLKPFTYIVGALSIAIAVPVVAAIVVQNFMAFTVDIKEPPIKKLAGADANTTDFLSVDLGNTISNQDDTLATPGTNPTLISNEVIEFSCFIGDRTTYGDVIQLQNTTAAENWGVNLKLEADFQGNPATSETFSDTNADGGDADIWLFVSEADSTTPITVNPNPGLYGTMADWYDADTGDAGVEAIQLEVVNSVLTQTSATQTNQFTIPGGEQRQIALVVDCGTNMLDEVAAATTGTFRVTVEATKL